MAGLLIFRVDYIMSKHEQKKTQMPRDSQQKISSPQLKQHSKNKKDGTASLTKKTPKDKARKKLMSDEQASPEVRHKTLTDQEGGMEEEAVAMTTNDSAHGETRWQGKEPELATENIQSLLPAEQDHKTDCNVKITRGRRQEIMT